MDATAPSEAHVHLEQHGFHPWFHLRSGPRSVSVRGSAWRGDRLCDASALAAGLLACFDKGLTSPACEHAADWLAGCNGAFSAVVVEGGCLFAAVDRYRLWPLFYAGAACGPQVGDCAETVAGAAGLYSRVPAARKVRRRFILQAQIPRLLEPRGLHRHLGRCSSRSIMSLAVKADRRVKQLSHYADPAYHLEYHLFGRFHDRCIHGMLPKEVYFSHVHAMEPWKASSLHLAACHHYMYREMMVSADLQKVSGS